MQQWSHCTKGVGVSFLRAFLSGASLLGGFIFGVSLLSGFRSDASLSKSVGISLSEMHLPLPLFPQKAGIANAFHLAPTRYWSNGFHFFIQPTPLPIQVFPFHHLLLERSELINICPHEKVLIGMYLPYI